MIKLRAQDFILCDQIQVPHTSELESFRQGSILNPLSYDVLSEFDKILLLIRETLRSDVLCVRKWLAHGAVC